LGVGGLAPTPNPQSPIPNPLIKFYEINLIYILSLNKIKLMKLIK